MNQEAGPLQKQNLPVPGYWISKQQEIRNKVLLFNKLLNLWYSVRAMKTKTTADLRKHLNIDKYECEDSEMVKKKKIENNKHQS